MADNMTRNQYNSTPRKVFDKAIDRMELKRARDKQDHRADLAVFVARIHALETALDDAITQLKEHSQEMDHLWQIIGETKHASRGEP